jgi:N-acetylmuramoyl-L-alanine amidase
MGRKITPPGYHQVEQGDWLAKLAKWYGIPKWQTIWEDANNAALRDKRKSPNILLPGDLVYIPKVESKDHSGGAEQTHSFKIPSAKAAFRTTLLDADGNPRAGVPYKVTVGQLTREGSTGGDGMIQCPIPVDAETVDLEVDGEVVRVQVGHLDPIDEVSGLQARLKNLGYDPGPIDGKDGPLTRAAVKAFQMENDLEVDGVAGPKTRGKLLDAYGA